MARTHTRSAAEIVNDTLAANLRRLMREKGWKQKPLSLAAGLNETAVRDILHGRAKRPLCSTIVALSKAVPCAPADLVEEWRPGERDELIACLRDLRDAVKNEPAFQDRKFDSLGIRVNAALQLAGVQ